MNALSAGAVLQARYASFKQKQTTDDASIENTVGTTTNNTSIELPQEIKALMTGSDFWVLAKTNRYKKLIREGHLNDLLELAKMALSKNNPAHWFAKVCSVKAWERTLDFLKKLYDVRKKAERVVERIGQHNLERMRKFVYKQIWAGKSVERYAVATQEIGENRHKLFVYLCRQE